MELWESPLWPLLDREGEWASWDAVRSCFPGGIDEARLHLQRFVGAGFSVQEDDSHGWRVTTRPDRLFPPWILKGLKTEAVGSRLIYYQTVNSTQDELIRLEPSGVPDGTVALCEYQQKGRGRRGRAWLSPPFSGVLMSVLIRSPGVANEAFVWTQIASVAVAEAVERAVGERVWIKWPNDLYLRGRKVCGILAEWQSPPGRAPFAVLGIGLNVLRRPESDSGATCLRDVTPIPPRRTELARWILESLDAWCRAARSEGWGAVRRPWVRRSWLLGKSIVIKEDDQETEGLVEDFLPDGRLQMVTKGGQRKAFAAGDVRLHLVPSGGCRGDAGEEAR